MQQTEMLALVLVQTLDLHVEQRVGVDLNAGDAAHILRQPQLVVMFDVAIALTKRLIVRIRLQAFQRVQVRHPVAVA